MATETPIILHARAPRHLLPLVILATGLGLLSLVTVQAELVWKLVPAAALLLLMGLAVLRLNSRQHLEYVLHPAVDRWQRCTAADSTEDPEPLEYAACPFNGKRWIVLQFRTPVSGGTDRAVFFRRHNTSEAFRRVKIWIHG